MRASKKELITDNLKPLVSKIIKENREKYNYSLEDLSKALNHAKNRQTLHKYENGTLNIPYDILFEICRIFSLDISIFDGYPMSNEEQKIIEKKMVRQYVNSIRKDSKLTKYEEKIINTYKNASYEAMSKKSDLVIRITDDSMSPIYEKDDKVYFQKQEDYKTGDDIVIAVKNNILSIRRLYRYPKGIILQAMNPKYQTINVNIISNDMILGKVVAIQRDIK